MPRAPASSLQIRVAKKVLKRTKQTRARPSLRTSSLSHVAVEPMLAISRPCDDVLVRDVEQRETSHAASQAPQAAKRVTFAKKVEYYDPPKRTWLFGPRVLGGLSQKADNRPVGVRERVKASVRRSQKLQLRGLKCIFAGI